jgi:hypothetical protein
MASIRKRRVLHDVLLQILSERHDGLEIHNVYDLIDAQYTFPEDWYRQIPCAQGYDILREAGVRDWRDVPQETLVRLVPTEPQWQNEIRWARNELRKEGYLNMSAPRGTWRLTEAGFAAARGVEQGDLSEPERLILATRKPAPEPTEGWQTGQRKDLLQKLGFYTQSMPLRDLELVVDIAWTIRKRSITVDSDAA